MHNKDKKNNKPEWSIIIPAYNSEKWICRSVNSALNCGIDSFEIIIVVNACTDNTLKVCQDSYGNNKRIKILNTKTPGLSNARNLGLDNAEGKYIAFCDSDDYFEINYLKKVSQAFLNNPKASIVCCGYYNVDTNGKKTCSFSFNRNKVVNSNNMFRYVMTDERVMGFAWNKYYKKEVFDDVRYDCTKFLLEDSYFMISLLKKHPKIETVIIPDKLHYYVQHNETITTYQNDIFNEKNKLKSFLLFDMLEQNFQFSDKEMSYINVAKYRLILFALLFGQYKQEQNKIMCNDLKKLWPNYLKHYLNYPRFTYLKHLIKGIVIWRKA